MGEGLFHCQVAAAAAYCLVLSCVNSDDGDPDLDFLGGCQMLYFGSSPLEGVSKYSLVA